jgi:hypothetical protein
MHRLKRLLDWLQKWSLIRDHIVVLKLNSLLTVEADRVPFHLIANFRELLEEFGTLGTRDFSTTRLIKVCAPAIDILRIISDDWYNITPTRYSAVSVCALAV